jgi:leucyl aminopeptidase
LAALEGTVVSAGSPAGESVVDARGHGLFAGDDPPEVLGMSAAGLARAGFDGSVGAILVLPHEPGPDTVVVGLGERATLTPAAVRDAAAAFARASARRARLHLTLPHLPGDVAGTRAAEAATEGVLLARYRYTALKSSTSDVPLTALTLEIDGVGATDIDAGITAALPAVRSCVIARDLANTPPNHLTATDLGTIALDLGRRFGFSVEIFDREALVELRCGGLLGVNQGSAEEPRMIRLDYAPERATRHLGLIGKGIMYDSGGISLKPSDPMHLLMKMDMGGAAAVLGAFSSLVDRGVDARVTAWLMCTDNMPSGSAYKLGDVLVTHGGTTIEVKNTDAEGRLVMSDAFDLAREAEVDAIIDIATLTGASMVALGTARAPVFASDDALAAVVLGAAGDTDEPLWRMPLERKYRPQLDSDIADISNLGGPLAGATTAALFLQHFAGETPWAHVDIAGTMQAEADDAWRSKGATGFGARLLLAAAAAYGNEVQR